MQEREILFRGKRVDTGEWVYGFYYKAKFYATDKELCDYITVPYPDEEERRSDHFIIDPETRGEYTGLTDKNGVKIFEGDIVHLYGDKSNLDTCSVNYNALVIFKDGGFCAIDGTPEDYGLRRYPFAKCDLHCEVIGNIHDNHELIKE